MSFVTALLLVYFVPVAIMVYFHSWIVFSAFSGLSLLLYIYAWDIISAFGRGAILVGPIVVTFIFGCGAGIFARLVLNLMSERIGSVPRTSVFAAIILSPPLILLLIRWDNIINVMK